MKRLFQILLLIAASVATTMPPEAWALTYYVNDCGTGASGTCTPNASGDTYNITQVQDPGTPIKTCARVKALLFATGTTMPAPSSILFAKGGAFDACAMSSLINTNASAANRITFGTYTPAGESAAPILNGTGSSVILDLLDSGNSDSDEGYTIDGLHFKGSTGSQLRMGQDVNSVTIQNSEFESATIGVQCAGQQSNAQNPGSNGLNERIVIKNSSFHDLTAIGYLGGCDRVLIEGNTFTNIGDGPLDHAIYLDGANVGTASAANNHQSIQNIVRNNTLTDVNQGGAGLCNGAAIVAHGWKRGLLIEGNTLTESGVTSSGGCAGISISTGQYGSVFDSKEGFEDVVVRRNRLKNYAHGIVVDICQYCWVYNNDVYSEYVGDAPEGIAFRAGYVVNGNGPIDSDDIVPTNVYVFNNTVTMRGTSNAIGYKVAVHATDVINGTDGDNYYFANNIINYLTGTTATSTCFNAMNVAVSKIKLWDNNLCYYSSTAGDWMKAGTTASTLRYATRAAWNAAQPSFDANSVSTDPVIASPSTSNAISTTSPAKDAGTTALRAWLDKLACIRTSIDATPDIGAFEYGCAGTTADSPTDITVN